MIRKILADHDKEFLIAEVRHERFLEDCLRTSFTWTGLPNSLCHAGNKKYYRQARENRNVRGIIAFPEAVDGDNADKALIIARKADELYYFLHNRKLHDHYPAGDRPVPAPHIAPTARIAPTAIIGKQVVIEDDVTIHDGCIIFDNSVIGRSSTIYPYVLIGLQGFFSKMILGKKTHLEHFGGVRVGSGCVIHAGTHIPRAVHYGEFTRIGDNVHVGSNATIGHDSVVEENCSISAKVVLSGRVKVGKNCWIGAGAIVSNSVSIGDDADIKIGSVVIDDVPAGASVSGNFARDHRKNLKEFLERLR